MSNYPHLNDDDERPEDNDEHGKGLPIGAILIALVVFIGLYFLVSGWLGDRVDYSGLNTLPL